MLERHLFNERVIRSVVSADPGVFMLIDPQGNVALVGRSDKNLADSLVEYRREYALSEVAAHLKPTEFVFRSCATSQEAFMQESEWRLLNPMLPVRRAPVDQPTGHDTTLGGIQSGSPLPNP